MTTTDHRAAAQERIQAVTTILQRLPPSQERDALIAECTSLSLAIRAFHMEGIRFRMFNVDRMIARAAPPLPGDAIAAFADARHHLEAAGFHTRSHQAPTQP
jgi:hypothetical protein